MLKFPQPPHLLQTKGFCIIQDLLESLLFIFQTLCGNTNIVRSPTPFVFLPFLKDSNKALLSLSSCRRVSYAHLQPVKLSVSFLLLCGSAPPSPGTAALAGFCIFFPAHPPRRKSTRSRETDKLPSLYNRLLGKSVKHKQATCSSQAIRNPWQPSV